MLSGQDTLVAEGAYYSSSSDGHHQFIIPEGAEAALYRSPSMGSVSGGVSSTLVLRVSTPSSSPTRDADEIAQDVFGTATYTYTDGDMYKAAYGEEVNMKNQYYACSNGQVQIQPVSVSGVTSNGVLDVKVTGVGKDAEDHVHAAIEEADNQLDTSSYAHVMVCLPSGTKLNGGGGWDWIGFAYIDYHISAYNDEWCSYVSTQMHETGHNLNLAHSWKDGSPYGDKSGYMGVSYKNFDGPKMCFNGPKTWQLGWYSEHHLTIDTSDTSNGSVLYHGNLYGFVDHDNVSNDDVMIIRLNTHFDDFYISFNRKSGFNSGTKLGGDAVMVHSKWEPHDDYGQSHLEAVLCLDGDDDCDSDSYELIGDGIVIRVLYIQEDSSGVMYARVQITGGACEDGGSYTHQVVYAGGKVVDSTSRECSFLANQPISDIETACEFEVPTGHDLLPPASEQCCETCASIVGSNDDNGSDDWDDDFYYDDYYDDGFDCSESKTEKYADKYLYSGGFITGVKTRTCGWLSRKPPGKQNKACNSDVSYGDFASAWDTCPITCGRCFPDTEAPSDVPSSVPSPYVSSPPGCEDEVSAFVMKAKVKNGSVIVKKTKTCKWLSEQIEKKITNHCKKNVRLLDGDGNVIIPAAKDVCRQTCGTCTAGWR